MKVRIAAGTLPRPDSGITEQIGDEAGFRNPRGEERRCDHGSFGTRARKKKIRPKQDDARLRPCRLLLAPWTGWSSTSSVLRLKEKRKKTQRGVTTEGSRVENRAQKKTQQQRQTRTGNHPERSPT
ncbi:hypothetical protein NDU88_000481 [Pleurodeles waltl]|uniref:Uncharacterized protein n=1 Tax=Pleurodeles waltl TaxID=8319 RepID=A0AAV7NG77_PLEWA|nr:hypothetical protein NDU88_000481 [Pleurodeles waltl]